MKILSCLLFLALSFASNLVAAQSVAEQQDARVIENLRSAGADLSKPHDIDFFVMLASQAQAEAVAAEMGQFGYTLAAIESSPDQSQWQVHAKRLMAPELEAMVAITRALEALASKHGGYYDGWGTAVVE